MALIVSYKQTLQRCRGEIANTRCKRAAAQYILCISQDDERTPTVITMIFFNGSEEEGQRYFSQLLEVECIKDDKNEIL